MGDDSSPVNLPKYRINIYFLSAFPLFLKPSCLLIHIMMGPLGTKPEFPFICKNCKGETLDLAQTASSASPNERNSSLPYFSCSVHARCLKKRGSDYFSAWSQSCWQGRETPGAPITCSAQELEARESRKNHLAYTAAFTLNTKILTSLLCDPVKGKEWV